MIQVGDIVERTVRPLLKEPFTWIKGSFGRVVKVSYSNVDVKLALSMMNNGDGAIASWSVGECKKRSEKWLNKRIKQLIDELNEHKRA